MMARSSSFLSGLTAYQKAQTARDNLARYRKAKPQNPAAMTNFVSIGASLIL